MLDALDGVTTLEAWLADPRGWAATGEVGLHEFAVSPVIAKYNARVAATGSMVCVGLDPEAARIPEHFRITSELGLFGFNRYVIEQTAPYAAAYKCNTAFYEAFGSRGWAELERTTEFLREHVPDALLICDAKRADIGNTNRGYVQGIFDAMGFDAITLHPYLGETGTACPFLERADKASIIPLPDFERWRVTSCRS